MLFLTFMKIQYSNFEVQKKSDYEKISMFIRSAFVHFCGFCTSKNTTIKSEINFRSNGWFNRSYC